MRPPQVYALGSISILLDNTHSNVRALLNGRWVSVTLEALLAAQKS